VKFRGFRACQHFALGKGHSTSVLLFGGELDMKIYDGRDFLVASMRRCDYRDDCDGSKV
jgi:hypothetical protein